MAAKLPPLPRPPEPRVQRFKADGTPTPAQVDFEAALNRYLAALAVFVGAV